MASTRNSHSLPGISIWSHFSSFKIILILNWLEVFLCGLGTRPETDASYRAQEEAVIISHPTASRGIFLVCHSSRWTISVMLPKALTWLAFKILSLAASRFQELHEVSKTWWSGGIALPLDAQICGVVSSPIPQRAEMVCGPEGWGSTAWLGAPSLCDAPRQVHTEFRNSFWYFWKMPSSHLTSLSVCCDGITKPT